MKIDVLISSESHPIFPSLRAWTEGRRASGDDVRLICDLGRCEAGRDLLFLISYGQIVKPDICAKYQKVLVAHASDLPRGRGMSPHIWQVIEGCREITVSLLEAEANADTGAIWAKRKFEVQPADLWDEVNDKLFAAEMELMTFAVDNFGRIVPTPQDPHIAPSYYRRRMPQDSRLDPDRSIAKQFDLLRICDPDRFPAFFDLHGCTYTLRIEKAGKTKKS